ncbi:hypothetical protein J437_LFUL008568 [Ladona fulva]|uniref:Uncharacterized protein n=1 Tax=Ladona fulva TaxID=123851 RepID=A0A8K0K5P3_LADFU|nr:hypothetical protein J437_LFUL008568 [Ladona fulva]
MSVITQSYRLTRQRLPDTDQYKLVPEMVLETNKFYHYSKGHSVESEFSRLKRWTETNVPEFFTPNAKDVEARLERVLVEGLAIVNSCLPSYNDQGLIHADTKIAAF